MAISPRVKEEVIEKRARSLAGRTAGQAATRRGFGSTVIESSMRHDLQGEVEFQYAPGGLRARFSIPPMYFRASTERVGRGKARSPIAMTRLRPCRRHAASARRRDRTRHEQRWSGVERYRRASPDLALLDVNLGNETSFEVAEPLAELGAPFGFATGYGDQLAFPPGLARAPKLCKPYVANDIKDIFTATSSSSGRRA